MMVVSATARRETAKQAPFAVGTLVLCALAVILGGVGYSIAVGT
jgi:hypothetical protein